MHSDEAFDETGVQSCEQAVIRYFQVMCNIVTSGDGLAIPVSIRYFATILW